MNVNIEKLLDECNLKERVYPGKRVVQKMPQPGDYKSHCVVYNWQNAERLRIEVRPGTSGRTLTPKDLKKYPVSFQAETYVDIGILDEDEDGEEETGKGKAGKGGSGGKKPKKKKASSLSSFANVAEGKLPNLGDIRKMVVMGKEIAKEAMATMLESFVKQIKKAKIAPIDLMADVGKMVTKYMPPSFMEAKGDTDNMKPYKYDREKNEPMFGGIAPS